MSIKYDSKREPLAEIIRKATVNATYVIPDLQRPYVWTPRQVTMLIDSLFRGWPFGSLLLWEVKPDCFHEGGGIPHRPFWQVVDRTGNDEDSKTSVLGQPATYQMVLDGQQRVQSLILAFGGDQWGFQLFDSDWAQDLQDRRVRPSNHWSKASLCVDLKKFKEELEAKKGIVRKIEAGKILEWAILDPVDGQSTDSRPANYVYPLETAKGSPGRFIRLSRFWDLVQKDLSEDEYTMLLEPMLKEHGVADMSLLGKIAVFMKVVENVKTNSFVHALQIESFELTPQWGKDDYSDAIVNIFTRLNTAGRTLTREEITLAWLKVGWQPELTDQKPAGKCLEELKSELGDCGFHLETDEIVRLISFVWSVENREGNLLDSKDLLKGDIVRSMAAAVAKAWKQLKPRIVHGAERIKDRDLVENHGSFNSIIVYVTWLRLVFDQFDVIAGTMHVKPEDDLEKKLNGIARKFLDLWVFGSQWANMWGEAAVANFQRFATELNAIHKSLKLANTTNLLTIVEASVVQMMFHVSVRATEHINTSVVRDRRRVHSYYPLLWVWHRLDSTRWQNSSVAMRTGRKRTSKLEVDHTVADALWCRLVDEEIQTKAASFTGTEEEKSLLAPDGFDNRFEAVAFINLLGNCSLLDKSFNISKSDKSLRSFIEDVHEFKEGKIMIPDWEKALSLTATLTSPEGKKLADIKADILSRDALIRKDLSEFISGTKQRVD